MAVSAFGCVRFFPIMNVSLPLWVGGRPDLTFTCFSLYSPGNPNKAFVCLKHWQSGVWFFPTVDVGRLPWRPTSDPGPSNLTTLPAYLSLEDKTQTEYEEEKYKNKITKILITYT